MADLVGWGGGKNNRLFWQGGQRRTTDNGWQMVMKMEDILDKPANVDHFSIQYDPCGVVACKQEISFLNSLYFDDWGGLKKSGSTNFLHFPERNPQLHIIHFTLSSRLFQCHSVIYNAAIIMLCMLTTWFQDRKQWHRHSVAINGFQTVGRLR